MTARASAIRDTRRRFLEVQTMPPTLTTRKPVFARPFFNLTVIKAPLVDLIAAFAGLPRPVSARRTPFSFPSQAYHASPADAPLLLWSPACAPELTAFMPQVGSGDYFVVEYACRRFGFEGVAIRSTTQDVECPVNEFIVYESNELRRLVRAMKDSPRWEFYTKGTPLPFENEAAYAAKRVRDRLQREALLGYAQAWGAPVREPEFWSSRQESMTLARERSLRTGAGNPDG